MKDYASMSDGQIAEEVAKFIELGGRKQKGEGSLYIKNNVWARFDPCNNPADAWPIILSNKIGINPGTSSDKWAAHYCNWDIAIADANPLRAAMVVFLMMKEGE